MILYAACAFGLEAIVKRELLKLGYESKVEQPGRIAFEGDWLAVCRTNLWLRTADRVSIRVAQFECPDFDALFETVKALPWKTILTADANFPVTGRSRKSLLTSVPAVQRTVKKAAVEGMKREFNTDTLDETGPKYPLDIALLDDVATLTLDTTGSSLHKRGYRKLVGEAPLKETLAAAMVDLSVWKPSRPLVDPFCGSGTIPIEAALQGLNVAPGASRIFAANSWPQIGQSIWNEASDEVKQLEDRSIRLSINGTDRDPKALELARYHAERAGVADQIHFQQKSFDELRSKREYGCVITNPPYGQRLQETKELLGLYESFPRVLQRLPTWSHYILTSMPRMEKVIQKRATRRRKLFNGRIECTYFQFLGPKPPRDFNPGSIAETPRTESIPQEPPQENTLELPQSELPSVQPISPLTHETVVPEPAKRIRREVEAVFGGLQPKDHEQAALFETRLRKRAHHLRRWPTKRGITCFRIYERDVPELPFVVDRYEDCIHITEYERPHERDLSRHAAWLELMTKAAAQALESPIQKVFLKSRVRRPDERQYKKVNQHGKLFTVNEAGLKFLVNLSDYVDTGLFLDHRVTRGMVRKEAEGKRFLNLFAYTGSFSVYAAAGGAESTVTVDLSRNYLDWAQKNLAVNGFESDQHRMEASDANDFIQEAFSRGQKFDLVVVDPPTFSNSKRTEIDWEVQAHHAEMLNNLYECLAPEAVVYFSTNFRRFKLAEAELSRFKIWEISKQTVPEDFRNKRIHRCWRMTT